MVLRYGGVYAEVGVECATPLDSVLRPGDSLVTGWEAEAATDDDALAHGMVRRRQLLQWWFAAAPGHPALQEVVDRVVSSVGRRLSEDPHRDALERTGPGVWTDVVLRYALRPPSSAQARGWDWVGDTASLATCNQPAHQPTTLPHSHHMSLLPGHATPLLPMPLLHCPRGCSSAAPHCLSTQPWLNTATLPCPAYLPALTGKPMASAHPASRRFWLSIPSAHSPRAAPPAISISISCRGRTPSWGDEWGGGGD